MTKKEVKDLAIKQLKTKKVQSIKKQLCENFTDKKQKKIV
jgi:hypothetical protein